jgi:hypothetical protein
MKILKILIPGIILSISSYSQNASSLKPKFNPEPGAKNLKRIRNEILNGRNVETVDSSIIIQFIDSVLSKIPTDRKFYFNVFNKIYPQVKGEIAEFMEWTIQSFCINYPNEFFNLSEDEIKEHAQGIGESFRTEEEFPLKTAKEYIVCIQRKTEKKYRRKVDLFSQEVIQKIK